MRHGGIKPSILKYIYIPKKVATRIYEIGFPVPSERFKMGTIWASRTIERKRQDMRIPDPAVENE